MKLTLRLCLVKQILLAETPEAQRGHCFFADTRILRQRGSSSRGATRSRSCNRFFLTARGGQTPLFPLGLQRPSAGLRVCPGRSALTSDGDHCFEVSRIGDAETAESKSSVRHNKSEEL